MDRGENNLICVFMSGVDQKKLHDQTIKMITKTVHCLQWPGEDEAAQKLFWLQLNKAILDGANDEEYLNEQNIGLNQRNAYSIFVNV